MADILFQCEQQGTLGVIYTARVISGGGEEGGGYREGGGWGLAYFYLFRPNCHFAPIVIYYPYPGE